MSPIFLSLLLFCALINITMCSKILFVSAIPASHSHFALNYRLAKTLCQRGHQVTMISSVSAKEKIKNYSEIVLPQIIKANHSLFDLNGRSPEKAIESIYIYGLKGTQNMLSNPEFEKFLNSGAHNNNFDLIFINDFENYAAIGILAYYFKAPVVLFGATGLNNIHNYFGNPLPLSYVPLLGTPFLQKMSYWERLQNFLSHMIVELKKESEYMPLHRQLFEEFVDDENADLDEILHKSVAFLMTYSNPILSRAVPRLPNVKEVGGFHLKSDDEFLELENDLKTFLDTAQDGVIIFTMGTLLKMDELSDHLIGSILTQFSKLKQRVIWKFGGELYNVPDNVKIMKWMPQQEVLAHPNVRLIIHHGGLLSLYEAIYNGIPMIVIPIFGDHSINSAVAVDKGFAIRIPYLYDLASNKLTQAINEILTKPSYKANAEFYSKLLREEQNKPLERAIYWIEYVIRHKGATHLRSPGHDLYWYQRESLDVVILIATVIICIIFLIYKILAKICRLIFWSRKSPSSNKKNL